MGMEWRWRGGVEGRCCCCRSSVERCCLGGWPIQVRAQGFDRDNTSRRNKDCLAMRA